MIFCRLQKKNRNRFSFHLRIISFIWQHLIILAKMWRVLFTDTPYVFFVANRCGYENSEKVLTRVLAIYISTLRQSLRHDVRLHSLFSISGPKAFPPGQFLVRFCAPIPQVTLQSDHSDHSVHLPPPARFLIIAFKISIIVSNSNSKAKAFH